MQFKNKNVIFKKWKMLKIQWLNPLKSFVAKIATIASDIDSTNEFPLPLWAEMGSMGILGVTAPEKYGGLNASYSLHCKIMSQISEYSASIGLSYAAPQIFVLIK